MIKPIVSATIINEYFSVVKTFHDYATNLIEIMVLVQFILI
ncbi:MAG: hypothetical protein ACK5UI_00020 [Bacteroidota bacterium]